MPDEILPIAHFWRAVVTSGYVTADVWQNWADNLILDLDNPEDWLLNLSLAKDQDSMIKGMRDRLEYELIRNRAAGDIDDAVIGYLYLRFQRGDFGLDAFLNKAGEAADAGTSSIECDWFYGLLNEYENSGYSEPVMRDCLQKVRLALAPFVERAKNEWSLLMAYRGT